jgi:hypothetical protein
MAALEIGARSLPNPVAAPSDHAHQSARVPAVVSFPFGLPEPGDYRIFVQIKKGGRIETGAFAAHVE